MLTKRIISSIARRFLFFFAFCTRNIKARILQKSTAAKNCELLPLLPKQLKTTLIFHKCKILMGFPLLSCTHLLCLHESYAQSPCKHVVHDVVTSLITKSQPLTLIVCINLLFFPISYQMYHFLEKWNFF